MEHRERYTTRGSELNSERYFLFQKSVYLSYIYLKYHLPKFLLFWWITRKGKELKQKIYHTPPSYKLYIKQCPCLICNLRPKEVPILTKDSDG